MDCASALEEDTQYNTEGTQQVVCIHTHTHTLIHFYVSVITMVKEEESINQS